MIDRKHPTVAKYRAVSAPIPELAPDKKNKNDTFSKRKLNVA